MVVDQDVYIICQTPYLSDVKTKEKQRKNKKRWWQTWSCEVGGAKATKQTSRIFCYYSIPQMIDFELPKYRRPEGIINGGWPRCPYYLSNTIIEWWENERKAKERKKMWCQTWSCKVDGVKATKQTNKIFCCYFIPQMTDFELPKYKRPKGIIDGGQPRCPYYLPDTIIEWWENERKAKEKQKRWCQTLSCKVNGAKATKKTSRIFRCYSIPLNHHNNNNNNNTKF